MEPLTLFHRLRTTHGWPDVNAQSAAEFIAEPGCRVLFVPGIAARRPETDDVAMVLDQLGHAFPGQLHAAVVAPADEETACQDLGLRATPALVFFADGVRVRAVERIQDWATYRDCAHECCQSESCRPGTRFAVVTEPNGVVS